MRTMDPGHYYFLDEYSGDNPEERLDSEQPLHFMHRIGDGYPGNQGSSYDGTNCQEVLRALIDRCKYLQNQIPCEENKLIIENLRAVLVAFERRAASRHGLLNTKISITGKEFLEPETIAACRTCGHIICKHK